MEARRRKRLLLGDAMGVSWWASFESEEQDSLYECVLFLVAFSAAAGSVRSVRGGEEKEGTQDFL